MSSNIPAARAALHAALLQGKTIEEMHIHILDALQMMTRSRYKAVTARASLRILNPALADRIRQHVRENAEQSVLEVARQFNVNPGRVSEALAGWCQ